MTDQGKTAFQEWHVSEMGIYRPILIDIREALRRIPRFPDFITETDKHILMGIAKALNVSIDEYDLSDVEEFFAAVGILKAEVADRLENRLRPRDPLTEAFREIEHLKEEAEEAADEIMLSDGNGEA